MAEPGADEVGAGLAGPMTLRIFEGLPIFSFSSSISQSILDVDLAQLDGPVARMVDIAILSDVIFTG